MSEKLITLEQYRRLSPKDQGFVIYVQAEWPDSELKEHQQNPYAVGAKEHEEWNRGQMLGMQVAQESEE
jgi:hypothetical protein